MRCYKEVRRLLHKYVNEVQETVKDGMARAHAANVIPLDRDAAIARAASSGQKAATSPAVILTPSGQTPPAPPAGASLPSKGEALEKVAKIMGL